MAACLTLGFSSLCCHGIARVTLEPNHRRLLREPIMRTRYEVANDELAPSVVVVPRSIASVDVMIGVTCTLPLAPVSSRLCIGARITPERLHERASVLLTMLEPFFAATGGMLLRLPEDKTTLETPVRCELVETQTLRQMDRRAYAR